MNRAPVIAPRAEVASRAMGSLLTGWAGRCGQARKPQLKTES